MDGTERQQGRDRQLGGTDAPVRDDEDIFSAPDRVDRFGAQGRQLGLDALITP